MCHGAGGCIAAQAGRESAELRFSVAVPADTPRVAPKHGRNPNGFSAAGQCGSTGRCCWGARPPLRSDLGHQCWDQTSWHPTLLRALRSPQHTPVPRLTALRDLRRPAELVRAAGGFWGQSGVGLEGLGGTHCLAIQLRAQTFPGLTGLSAASGTSSSWGFYDPF